MHSSYINPAFLFLHPAVTDNQQFPLRVLAWCCSLLCASTWALLCGAGNYPLHKAALHQRFTREPWSLPLRALRLTARVWLFPIGIRQQTAIDRLLICLKTERNCPLREKREADTPDFKELATL